MVFLGRTAHLLALLGALLAGCSVVSDQAPTTSGLSVSATTAGADPTTTSVTTTRADAPAMSPLVARWARDNDVVGAVVLVATGDDAIEASAVGFADRESQDPMSTDRLFLIGSITKVYTAALVLDLAEAGIISLGEPAANHVSAMPDPVTVAQLLSHTSGLRDVDVAAGIVAALENGALSQQPGDAVLDALEQGLAFEPGTRQSYSSVGYLALERVVVSATGQPYGEVLSERILAPGTSTMIETAETPLPTPYERLAPGAPAISLRALPTTGIAQGAGAAGALVATAEDVARFIRSLFAGEVISAESLALMIDDAPPRRDYGLGLSLYRVAGREVYGHNGRTIGFAASVRHDPASRVTVVVLANDGGAPTDELAEAIIAERINAR